MSKRTNRTRVRGHDLSPRQWKLLEFNRWFAGCDQCRTVLRGSTSYSSHTFRHHTASWKKYRQTQWRP